MPVYIYNNDTLEKMAIIENVVQGFGEHWLADQMSMQKPETPEDVPSYMCSFVAFLNTYMGEKDEYEKMTNKGYGDESIFSSFTFRGCLRREATIYGAWGWNRYLVQFSGEIVFLEDFAYSDECVNKALELGFRVK